MIGPDDDFMRWVDLIVLPIAAALLCVALWRVLKIIKQAGKLYDENTALLAKIAELERKVADLNNTLKTFQYKNWYESVEGKLERVKKLPEIKFSIEDEGAK